MKYIIIILLIITAETAIAQSAADNISVIKCDADTSQSYSIYLPENYAKAKPFPVIFLFDPSAQGKIAVGLFKDAAKTLGFIVVSSNNSQNGPISLSLNAAGAVFTDVFKKYNIDNKQIYLSGFSGGARIATTIAMQNSGIAGVLACGAGFTDGIPRSALPWPFQGTTGTRDFNNIELRQIQQHLDDFHSTNNLIIFKGPHRWPPAPVILEALLWLDLQHRKNVLTTTDINLLKYRAIVEDRIAKTESLLQKADMYKQLQALFADKAYAEKITELTTSKPYKDELAFQQQLNAKEIANQKKLGDALLLIERGSYDSEPKSWWKNEYNALEKMQASGLSADTDFFYRQKANVHANINVDFQNFLEVKKYDIVAELLKVSEIFDAGNPGVPYHQAQLAAAQGYENEAISYLEKAIKQGLRNKSYLLNDPNFQFLRTNKHFMALVSD